MVDYPQPSTDHVLERATSVMLLEGFPSVRAE